MKIPLSNRLAYMYLLTHETFASSRTRHALLLTGSGSELLDTNIFSTTAKIKLC